MTKLVHYIIDKYFGELRSGKNIQRGYFKVIFLMSVSLFLFISCQNKGDDGISRNHTDSQNEVPEANDNTDVQKQEDETNDQWKMKRIEFLPPDDISLEEIDENFSKNAVYEYLEKFSWHYLEVSLEYLEECKVNITPEEGKAWFASYYIPSNMPSVHFRTCLYILKKTI